MKRVLVVDDDSKIRGLVAQWLRGAGYEVFSAMDGQEGLELAKSEKPHLVVLDLAMPRMHGFEVCQRLREDGELSAVKIVVTSGKNFAADIKTAQRLGADHYLLKPFDDRELLQVVTSLLPPA